jgi:hypothetical protein
VPNNKTLWQLCDYRIYKNANDVINIQLLLERFAINGKPLKQTRTLDLPLFPGLDDILRRNIERAICLNSVTKFKEKRFSELMFSWSQLRRYWILDPDNNLIKAHWQKKFSDQHFEKLNNKQLKIWKLSDFAFVLRPYSFLKLTFSQDNGDTTCKYIYLMRQTENEITSPAVNDLLLNGFYQQLQNPKRKSQIVIFDFLREIPKWIVMDENDRIKNAFKEKFQALHWIKTQ